MPETGLQFEYPSTIHTKNTTLVNKGVTTVITGDNITKEGHSLFFTDLITGKDKGILFIDWPGGPGDSDSNITTIPQYMEEQTKLDKEFVKNYKLIELSNRFTAGNVSGSSQLFTGIYSGESLTSTSLEVAVLIDSKLHTFTFSSYDSYSELLPAIMKILETVRVSPGLPDFDTCILNYQYGNTGFKIQHPYNFIGLVENVNIQSAQLVPRISPNPNSNLSINIDVIDYDGTIQEYYNMKKNILSNIVASNANSVLGGNTAYMLITDHVNGTALKRMNIGTVFNNKVYEINFYADENTYTQLLPTVQRMIETFEITR